MSILVSAHQIRKAFAARPLFDSITFAIETGERIGLIGPNGAGKSTLLKIIAGQESPDEGSVSFQRGLRVGFLEQVPQFKPGMTVQAAVLSGAPDPTEWESVHLCQELMSRLELVDGPVDSLSGGWKKRVALARELVKNPDLLLLDEPTNHLDVESILWLEDFLAHAPFAVMTITHDRQFLQKVANRILELDRRNPGGLLSVAGDYATYLEVKDQLMAAQEQREVVLKNTLRRETEWLRRGAKARTTKQQARIQRAGALGEEVEELSARNQTRTARIEFQSTEKSPKKLVEAKGLVGGFGERRLFGPLDLLVTPGTRLGLLGPNGCGKSTLIRMLLGQLAPEDGEVKHSDQLQVAYFEQNRETLDPTLTVAKTVCPSGDFVDYRGGRVHVKGYLDKFLFSYGQMDMAVGKLSGGEQSRLLIARLMLHEANVLVMDEPTNDLDMATLNVLEDCLQDFPGAVILVTHDRYFLDQVATKILAFGRGGKVLSFADLAQWETWRENEAREQQAAVKKAAAVPAPQTAGAGPAKKRKLSYKDQREFDTMEETIQKAEDELARLMVESQKPEVVSNSIKLAEISKEMTRVQSEIDRLYIRWGELGQ